ncbi:MAG: hypothetical protein ACOC1K_02170 [Nanoarchaeota archaeon]
MFIVREINTEFPHISYRTHTIQGVYLEVFSYNQVITSIAYRMYKVDQTQKFNVFTEICVGMFTPFFQKEIVINGFNRKIY